MKRIGKRFIALLIVFASMFSFIPLQFGDNGEEAKAANESSVDLSYADLKLRVAVGSEILSEHNDDSIGKLPYYNTADGESSFDLTIKDFSKTESTIKSELLAKFPDGGTGETTYVSNAYMNITSINNIKIATPEGQEIATGLAALQDLDIGMVKISPSGSVNRFGVRITEMPYGVDRIDYNLLGTVKKIRYTVNKDTGTVELVELNQYENVNLSDNIDSIIINNGTDFVGRNVESFTLDQYVGDRTKLDDESTLYNNAAPFLYTATAESDKTIKMRYTWEVPDSLSALNYKMQFQQELFNTGENTTVYVNGNVGQGQAIDTKTISGFLDDLNNSDQFVVIKINTAGNITKKYSAEVRFPKKKTDNDFSLVNAGVLKAEYANDPSVKAYISKRFNEVLKKDADGNQYIEYTGQITIDPKARMVCLRPTFISEVNKEYELYNNYTLNGITKTAKAYELIDGQAYVDFSLGEDNELELQVKDASSKKLLAKYIYTVVKREGAEEAFAENFKFDDDTNTNTYLTREGSSEKVSFKVGKSENRSTFDLYTANENEVKISLDPNGITNNKEYFKVFISENLSGNDFTEAPESVENEFSESTAERLTDLYVNIEKAKRIMIQAYYDEYTGDSEPFVLKRSYPVGSKYTFFVKANIDSSDSDSTEKSNDATLSNIKVKGQSLYNMDKDKNGFDMESRNYRVTMPKDSKTAILTVTPQDQNVKSITATVAGTDTSYDIYPSEETELMLNSSGITDLEITVTAQDGKTIELYSLSIINSSKGGSSKLKSLVLSSGDYSFDPDELTTKVQVESSVDKISITPIAEDSKAKITVNGQKFTGKPISISLAGKQSKEVDIEVESEDGASTTTYTLKIKRVSVIEDDDNGGQGITEDIYYDHDNECWVDTSKYDEWGTVNNRVMYFDKRGRQVKDRWIYTGKKWYYINEAGYRSTGWKVDNETGQRYYMDNTTGEMKLGMMYLNGSWYYLGTTGVMHTGWLWMNNNWYYFTENGEMITNQNMVIDGKEYRFATDGRIY